MVKQGRSRQGPEHIAHVLDAFFKQQGIEASVRAHRVVVDWDTIVGDAVSCHTRAVHIEHGTLVVEVENPGWMHRLQMQEQDIRTRINCHFSEEIIEQIRFRLGSTPTRKPEREEGGEES